MILISLWLHSSGYTEYSVLIQATTTPNINCQMKGPWDVVSLLKSLKKQLQRRHRRWCLKEDPGLILLGGYFITFTINRKQCAGII